MFLRYLSVLVESLQRHFGSGWRPWLPIAIGVATGNLFSPVRLALGRQIWEISRSQNSGHIGDRKLARLWDQF